MGLPAPPDAMREDTWRALASGVVALPDVPDRMATLVLLAIAFALLLVVGLKPSVPRRRPRLAPPPPHPEDHLGRARVEPGRGGFEWHPAGQPMPPGRTGAGLRHTWWDAERGGRAFALLEFGLPDGTPADLVDEAVVKALRKATSALPARGKARVRAALEDVPGPTSVVRVRLEAQGLGATPEWARLAADAFAREFARRLARRGVAVTQR